MNTVIKSRLADVCRDRGVTYSELARRTGIRQYQRVYEYCRGIRRPSGPVALAICRALDCRPRDIWPSQEFSWLESATAVNPVSAKT